MHLAASQREGERVQAVKSGSQASSLVKYLEQREVSLLSSLQEARKKHGKKKQYALITIHAIIFHLFVQLVIFLLNLPVVVLVASLDEKCREMAIIIEEHRSIIQTLKEEYATLIEDFQKSLVSDDS